MTYSQQKFEAGGYSDDSLYGRLGELGAQLMKYVPSFDTEHGSYYASEFEKLTAFRKHQFSMRIGAWLWIKEIIARVEARIEKWREFSKMCLNADAGIDDDHYDEFFERFGKLQKTLLDCEVSIDDYEGGSWSAEEMVKELTRLLVGNPHCVREGEK